MSVSANSGTALWARLNSYGLRLCGVKSLDGFADMTIIAGTAYLLTGITVYGLKSITKIERPDGSSKDSFPSGHTATAFVGAELLRREYWNVCSRNNISKTCTSLPIFPARKKDLHA